MKFLYSAIILFCFHFGSVNSAYSQTHKHYPKKSIHSKKTTTKADTLKKDTVKKEVVVEPTLEETRTWINTKLKTFNPLIIHFKSKDGFVVCDWKILEFSFDNADNLILKTTPVEKSQCPKDLVITVTIDFSKLDPTKTTAVENPKSTIIFNLDDNNSGFAYVFSNTSYANKFSKEIFSMTFKFSNANYEYNLSTRMAKAFNRLMNLKGSNGTKPKEAF
ncbi:MAG: hypothetical protein PHD97_04115 [Bacteroidales bacterium]|nr:hypothetical protein [Bacteroidales bacterium]